MKKLKLLIIGIFISWFIFISFFAQADTKTKIINIFKKLQILIFNIGLALAVLSLIYVGMLYITGGVRGMDLSKFHSALIWVLIGITLLVIASSIPMLLKKFLTTNL